MSSPAVKALILLAGVLAMVFGVWMATTRTIQPLVDEEVGFVYPEPRPIKAFELVDMDNQPFNLDSLKDKWWLVYFGFTFCPDACPTALNDMKKIKLDLGADVAGSLGYLFVSVDPGRDTPERLKEYVQYFDPGFSAATGTPQALTDLATSVGVVFFVPENPEDQNYTVDHSTSMLLINPNAQLQAIFRAPHDPARVADGIENIIKDYSG